MRWGRESANNFVDKKKRRWRARKNLWRMSSSIVEDYKKVFGEKFLHWNRVSLKERCLGEFVAIRELKEGESIVR